MTNTSDADLVALARGCWASIEPIHVIGYFAPEPTEAYVALGLHPRLSYFAARSAAFGPVAPAVTVATFYVFAPWLVNKALPAAWDLATPEQVQEARREGVSVALRRVLGEPDVSEAVAIARRVCDGLTAPGRPLYAAHSALPWPDDDLLALWHAATLVREHRGDGHVAALQTAGLRPVESLVLGGLFADNTAFVRKTCGWSDEEWAAGVGRLRERGLLTSEGDDLSDEGRTVRQRIEDQTDELAVEGWAHVGVDDCRRFQELTKTLRTQVLASGELPDWIKSRS